MTYDQTPRSIDRALVLEENREHVPFFHLQPHVFARAADADAARRFALRPGQPTASEFSRGMRRGLSGASRRWEVFSSRPLSRRGYRPLRFIRTTSRTTERPCPFASNRPRSSHGAKCRGKGRREQTHTLCGTQKLFRSRADRWPQTAAILQKKHIGYCHRSSFDASWTTSAQSSGHSSPTPGVM